jgi:PAS domain S-box-containing protein
MGRNSGFQRKYSDEYNTMMKKYPKQLGLIGKIISVSPFGIMVYNSSGQCVLANEAASEILGFDNSDLLSQNYMDLEFWKKSGLFESAEYTMRTGIEEFIQVFVKTSSYREIWLDCRFEKFIYENRPHLLLFFNNVIGNKREEPASLGSEINIPVNQYFG